MEVFPISPATDKPLWFLTIICILLATILIALLWVAYSSRNSRVEVSGEHLRIVGDFWGRRIRMDALDVPAVRILDLDQTPELRPKRRTLGTGLPGYASGWFRLQNGEKSLVYLTDRHRVVHIPTSADYSLLLSIDDPERFVQALQRWAH